MYQRTAIRRHTIHRQYNYLHGYPIVRHDAYKQENEAASYPSPPKHTKMFPHRRTGTTGRIKSKLHDDSIIKICHMGHQARKYIEHEKRKLAQELK